MSTTGLAGELRQIRTGTKANFQLCRLPIQSQVRLGPTHSGPVAEPSRENTGNAILTDLSSPAIHVLDRFTNSHRKASASRPTTYETHTVAPQKQIPESLEKVIPLPTGDPTGPYTPTYNGG